MRPVHTPWGQPDSFKEYAPGIIQYSTPSHGGFFLDAERNAQVNTAFNQAGSFAGQRRAGWYEEDCDWSIVVVTFPEFFTEETRAEARQAVSFWHKEAAAKFFASTPRGWERVIPGPEQGAGEGQAHG